MSTGSGSKRSPSGRALAALFAAAPFAVACGTNGHGGGTGDGSVDAIAPGSNSGGSGGVAQPGSGGGGGSNDSGGTSHTGGSRSTGGSSNTGGRSSGGSSAGGASDKDAGHVATGGAGGSTASGGSIGGGTGGGTASGGTSGDDGSVGGRTYTTHFPLTENPISEGGNWIDGQTTGLDWHDISTTPGLAIGHQSGASYTDGTALLTGSWGPTQTVEATVHSVNPKDSCYQEVEMRLRSSLSAHSCTGYEISFKASNTSSAYLIIVRWNGAVGDFTMLEQYNGSQYGVSEGDTVKATIAGNVITAYLNGVEMGSATDDTYADGSPGMGFNLETGDSSCIGTNGDYGFTSYTATGE